jgi:polysaccharide biosynthesis protein PslG
MDQEPGKSRYVAVRGPVVAALAIALALLPAASAGAVNREFYGIVSSNHPDATQFRTMGDARVGTFRFQLDWRRIQPTEGGPYGWSSADSQVENAAVNGIELLPVLYGSPEWASGSYREPPLGSEEDKQAWKDFLAAAVQRYGPDGAFWQEHPGIDAHPIRAWQVWNEVNSPTYWEPNPSPKKYAELLKISDDAISNVDQGAEIILAGMFGTPSRNKGIYSWKFLERLYGINGAASHFDAVAVHPYSPNLAGIKAQIELMRKRMKNAGDAKTPVWVTEIGWGSANTRGQPLNKSLAGQKKMLRKSFNLLLGHRGKWKIKRILWFTWRDPGDGEDVTGVICGWCGSAGLVHTDLNPKPSFDAFRRFTVGS